VAENCVHLRHKSSLCGVHFGMGAINKLVCSVWPDWAICYRLRLFLIVIIGRKNGTLIRVAGV